MPVETRFVGYPDAFVFADVDGRWRKVQHVIFGDWLRLRDEPDVVVDGTRYVAVRARGVDGYMLPDAFQRERVLEITFVDIGQGDGVHMVTPDDDHFVIDAGDGDNMMRYLRWRFGGFERPMHFRGAVVTHADADHYRGFGAIFDLDNLTFETMFHNGLVERKAASGQELGARPAVPRGQPSFVTGLVEDEAGLRPLLADPQARGGHYLDMLEKGLDTRDRFDHFRALSVDDGHLPGYGPGDEPSIEVLGPVRENGGLRWFGSVGKTKNGHSVVLRLVYHNISVLLGGDLNIPAEELLLRHHTGIDPDGLDSEGERLLVDAARAVFAVDVAKSCHHGSADFSSLFLRALNPLATVVSSGDDEPHSHPRADALGTIGLHSRGPRPLIFSTELARSAKDTIKHPHVLRGELTLLNKLIRDETDPAEQAKLQRRFDAILAGLDRSIAVYGAINLRTDGHRAIVAQKLERRAGSRGWDIYRLEEASPNGPLHFVSQH